MIWVVGIVAAQLFVIIALLLRILNVLREWEIH